MAAQNTNLSPRIHQNQNLRQVNYGHRLAITQLSVTAKKTIAKNILISFKSSSKRLKVQKSVSMSRREQDELPTIFEKLSTFSGNF